MPTNVDPHSASLPADVRRRLRGAYERSRLALGLWLAPLSIPAAVALWWLGERGALATAAAAVWALAPIAFAWRGGALDRAVVPGLALGAVAFLASLAGELGGGCHIGSVCTTWCTVACSVSGVALGAAAARAALASTRPLSGWLGLSVFIVSGTALGCSCSAHGGVLGALAGLALTGLPVWGGALSRAR